MNWDTRAHHPPLSTLQVNRDQSAACAASPLGCRTAPRCQATACGPADTCCLAGSASQCAALGATNATCAASSRCSLIYSPCWDARRVLNAEVAPGM